MNRLTPRLVWPLLAALVGGSSAHAQLSLPADWAERPGREAMSSYYPKLPLALEIEGEVLLSCRVAPTGLVEACSALTESPAKLGFAAAALRMSRAFQMRPAMSLGGRKPDNEVRIPIRFKLPEPPPRTPRAEAPPSKVALVRRLVAAVDPLAGVALKYEAMARDLEFQTLPGAPEDAGPAGAAALRQAVLAGLPQMREAVGLMLAQRLGEAELAEVVRFAETPEGRRYLGYDAQDEAGQAAVGRQANDRRMAAVREAFCALRSCATGGVPVTWDRDDPEAPLTDVPWASQPTSADLSKAWPVAWMVGLSGFAQLSCDLGPRGAPEACKVVAESPDDVGLGDAALSLADRYKLPSALFGAGLVGRKVALTRFFHGPGRPAASADAPALDASRLALAQQLVDLQVAAEPKLDFDAEIDKQLDDFPMLDRKLRADLKAALVKAAPVWQAAVRDGRARLLATRLDDTGLRAAIAFESSVGGPLRRAALADREAVEAAGKSFAVQIAAAARATFCANRTCGTSGPGPKAGDAARP